MEKEEGTVVLSGIQTSELLSLKRRNANHFTGHTRLIVFYETILKKFLRSIQTTKDHINGNSTKLNGSIKEKYQFTMSSGVLESVSREGTNCGKTAW